MQKLKPISRLAIALSALLMISAYYVPIWQILMWAPQYPEGLSMQIWINNITGDVKIISGLNHYIGMKHIDVNMFPEFTYMIYIVGALIAFGILTAIINRRFMMMVYVGLIIISGIAALVDFYLWGYDYGHNLDPTAPIVVPGMSYQPPLIGTKQLLNFTAFSGPDTGGWIFFTAALLVIATLAHDIYTRRKIKTEIARTIILIFCFTLYACSAEPEKLNYSSDACHTCKMTLMDSHFGAEIVSKKGKVYKFDDFNCMLKFYHGGDLKEEDVAHLLVVDYSTTGKLIDGRNALYVKSPKIKSPMAGNVAAFEKKPPLDEFNKEWRGILLSWGEIQTQFK